VSNNFLPTLYDARNNRLFGARPDGTYAYVDPNPTTRNSQNPDYIYVSDTENIIEFEVPTGKHYVVYLPDGTLDNYINNSYPTNSEIQVVNIGQGSLEVIFFGYTYEPKSVNGTQLTGQWAEAKLRCRGENDWIVNGQVGPSNAKNYSVVNSGSGAYAFTGEGLTSESNPSLTLMVNQELILTVDATGHPLWIKDVGETGEGTASIDGAGPVDNNGAQTAVIRFRAFTAGTYYYNCQYHAGMRGTITVS
jgi:hypothetical protein